MAITCPWGMNRFGEDWRSLLLFRFVGVVNLMTSISLESLFESLMHTARANASSELKVSQMSIHTGFLSCVWPWTMTQSHLTSQPDQQITPCPSTFCSPFWHSKERLIHRTFFSVLFRLFCGSPPSQLFPQLTSSPDSCGSFVCVRSNWIT